MDPNKLAGISKSFSEKTGSPLDPELDAFLKSQMGVFQPSGPQVAPPKPDPEAEANAQINRAVNPQRAALQQIARPQVAAPVAPPVNNVTLDDYMQEPPAQSNYGSEDEKAANEAMKAEYFRNISRSGQLGK